jgi:hypothetical protein
MNLLSSPYKFFWAGLACVFLGFALPFLIVLGYIKNSFALSFFIFTLQLVGMILGTIAAAGLGIRKRAKDKRKKLGEKAKEDDQESTTGWME